MAKRVLYSIFSVILCLGMASCASTRRANRSGSGAAEIETGANKEEALANAVARVVESTDDAPGRVLRRRPYFFKEYAAYPSPESFKTEIIETESRSRPFTAEVILSKTRFATKLHSQKKDARDDNQFFRYTGKETLTFEWRNKGWQRVGSVLVADKAEEEVNGAWRPVQETPTEVQVAKEAQKKDWLGRMWSGLWGRN
jgi:hypothetical protein